MAFDPLGVISTTADPHSESSGGFVPQVIGGIALAVWVLFSNLTLIIAILRSEHRRKVTFNLHVCNLSLASILMGGFVLPFFIDIFIKDRWAYEDNLCRMWLMADMMVCTVSVLVVTMMIFDRFVLFSCPDSAEGGCKFVLSAVLIVLPWAFGSAIVLPIYLFGETGEGVKEDNGLCFLHLKPTFSVVAEIAGFVVPGLVAVALLVATSLTWCVKKEELRDMDYSEEREHKGWQVLTSWIICLFVIGMWLPFAALHILSVMLDRSWPDEWWTFAIWLAYANSGVNPLLWMVMPRLRQSVRFLCCCCCRHKHRYGDDSLDGDETHAAMIEFHEKPQV